MGQGAGLQDVPGSLAAQLPPGDSAEIIVDQRHQVAQRRLIPLAPRHEQAADILAIPCRHIEAILPEIPLRHDGIGAQFSLFRL